MQRMHQRLLAPAVLGLLAGLPAVTPAPLQAAELNLDGIHQYASSDQVTSISQFPDVVPTDWAYQALTGLIERYGCVAGYPDGTFKGQRAMTRFEAAALLNACLDRVTEVTDELKRLMAEFERELAILKGRVDGLEAKVGELEASQFSTTTVLSGEAVMTIGGAGNTGFGGDVTVNYKLALGLATSFTGKDLLYTELEAGNFDDSVFGNGNTVLEAEAGTGNSVELSKLFYQFPIGENFTATVGANVEQNDMLAIWPSAYPADTILDIFTYAGGQSTYNLTQGAGVGIWWENEGWAVSALYVADLDASQNSSIGAGEDYTITVQGGYAGENWGGAIAYTYSDFNNLGESEVRPGLSSFFPNASNQNIGVSGYWAPIEAGWAPSISAGFGWTDYDRSGDDEAWSWMVGLQWADMFMQGNALGMALGSVGQRDGGNCANVNCSASLWVDGSDGDENLAYELWYKWQVTDNISVTPAFFYVQNTGVDDTYGGLIKTTFEF